MNTKLDREFTAGIGYSQGYGEEIRLRLYGLCDRVDALTAEVGHLTNLREDCHTALGRCAWENGDLRAALAKAEQERDAAIADTDNIKQVEFPKRLASVADGWKAKVEQIEAERDQCQKNSLFWQNKVSELSDELQRNYNAAAGAAPVPEGYQLVPVEPTPEMCKVSTWDFHRFYQPSEIYKAMLTAAKEPT